MPFVFSTGGFCVINGPYMYLMLNDTFSSLLTDMIQMTGVHLYYSEHRMSLYLHTSQYPDIE